MNNIEEFVQQVTDAAKQILKESKSLAEIVDLEDAEEKFPECARNAAQATSRLIELVNGTTIEDTGIHEELADSTRETRDCLLELCRATKAAISNPLDFLTTQKLTNCRKKIALVVKQVLEISEGLLDGGGTPAESASTELLEDAKAAVQSISKMVQAARQTNQEAFIENAKTVATSISKLIEVAKGSKNAHQETLFDATQKIIAASKLAFRNPGNKQYSQDLEVAMKNVAEEIKTFVMNIQKTTTAASLATLTVNPGSASTPVASPIPSPTPQHSGPSAIPPHVQATNNSSQSSTPATSQNSSPVASPSVVPANTVTPSKSSMRKSPAPTEQKGTTSPPESMSPRGTTSPRGERSPDATPSPSAEWRLSTESAASSEAGSIRRPDSASGSLKKTTFAEPAKPIPTAKEATTPPGDVVAKSNESIEQLLKEYPPGKTSVYLIEVIKLFLEDFKNLRVEWVDKGETSQEAFIKKLEALKLNAQEVSIKEKLEAYSKRPQISIEDEKAEAELDQLKNLKDFAEWKRMTMGVSLRKQFSNIVGEALRAASINNTEDLKKDTIAPQLVDIGKAFAEGVLDLMLKVYLSSAAQANATDVEESVVFLYDILKKILILCKRALTLSASATAAPVYSKITNSIYTTVETSLTKGTMDEGVRAVATSLLAKLVGQSLKGKLYRETNGVRVLAVHMMSTINAVSNNRSSVSTTLALQLIFITRALIEAVVRLLCTYETSNYMDANKDVKPTGKEEDEIVAALDVSQEPKSKSKSKLNAKLNALVTDADLNKGGEAKIGDEPEINAKEMSKGISAGSLNKLVLALTSPTSYDNRFVQTFITTYRSFIAPQRLFQKLLERYSMPGIAERSKSLNVSVQTIPLRVTVVSKYWIEHQFFDFDEDLIGKMREWIEVTLPKDGYTDVANGLKTVLNRLVEERNEKINLITRTPPTDLTIPDSKLSFPELFMALNDEEIARQLTLIEFAIYKGIEPSELLNQSWNKDKLKYRASNVIESISRLNRLSFWVPSIILFHDKMKDRARVYTKLVSIGEHLRKMNNYNSLMGIVAGLNMSSINRLKHTLNEAQTQVPTASETFKALVKLMNPQSSFKAYRQTLHKSKTPCIPYLGVYLTDLTFIEDGNPDFVNNTQINFEKRKLIFNVLQEVKLYQTTGYAFPPVEPINTFLSELPYCGEKELYELSLLREPRDAELSQIVQ